MGDSPIASDKESTSPLPVHLLASSSSNEMPTSSNNESSSAVETVVATAEISSLSPDVQQQLELAATAVSGREETKQQAVLEMSPNKRYVRFDEETMPSGGLSIQSSYKAFDTKNGIEVAWHMINLNALKENEQKQVLQALNIVKKIQNKYIIEYLACWYREETRTLSIITSHLSTLKEFISKVMTLRWRIVKKWCRQILRALDHLHTSKPEIVHRNLTCSHIYMDSGLGATNVGGLWMAAILADDSANPIGLSDVLTRQLAQTSPAYTAPEMFEMKPLTTKVDIYSFGMCVLEMITREEPYKECMGSSKDIKQRASSGRHPQALERVAHPLAREFLTECLRPEDQRPSASELLQHLFLVSLTDGEDDEEVTLGPLEDSGAEEKQCSGVAGKDSFVAVSDEMSREPKESEQHDIHTAAATTENISKEVTPPELDLAVTIDNASSTGGGANESFTKEEKASGVDKLPPEEFVNINETAGFAVAVDNEKSVASPESEQLVVVDALPESLIVVSQQQHALVALDVDENERIGMSRSGSVSDEPKAFFVGKEVPHLSAPIPEVDAEASASTSFEALVDAPSPLTGKASSDESKFEKEELATALADFDQGENLHHDKGVHDGRRDEQSEDVYADATASGGSSGGGGGGGSGQNSSKGELINRTSQEELVSSSTTGDGSMIGELKAIPNRKIRLVTLTRDANETTMHFKIKIPRALTKEVVSKEVEFSFDPQRDNFEVVSGEMIDELGLVISTEQLAAQVRELFESSIRSLSASEGGGGGRGEGESHAEANLDGEKGGEHSPPLSEKVENMPSLDVVVVSVPAETVIPEAYELDEVASPVYLKNGDEGEPLGFGADPPLSEHLLTVVADDVLPDGIERQASPPPPLAHTTFVVSTTSETDVSISTSGSSSIEDVVVEVMPHSTNHLEATETTTTSSEAPPLYAAAAALDSSSGNLLLALNMPPTAASEILFALSSSEREELAASREEHLDLVGITDIDEGHFESEYRVLDETGMQMEMEKVDKESRVSRRAFEQRIEKHKIIQVKCDDDRIKIETDFNAKFMELQRKEDTATRRREDEIGRLKMEFNQVFARLKSQRNHSREPSATLMPAPVPVAATVPASTTLATAPAPAPAPTPTSAPEQAPADPPSEEPSGTSSETEQTEAGL